MEPSHKSTSHRCRPSKECSGNEACDSSPERLASDWKVSFVGQTGFLAGDSDRCVIVVRSELFLWSREIGVLPAGLRLAGSPIIHFRFVPCNTPETWSFRVRPLVERQKCSRAKNVGGSGQL